MLQRLPCHRARSASPSAGECFVQSPFLVVSRRIVRAGASILIAMVASAAIFFAHAAQVGYVYDDEGRLVQVIAPNGASEQYRYDAAGNIVEIRSTVAAAVAIASFT